MNKCGTKKAISYTLSATATSFIPVIESILAPLLNRYPYWGVVWGCAIGLYSLYLYYQQDKVNEIVEFISENPDVFTQQVVEGKLFRSNFLRFLRDYLLQENINKKNALKKILLGTIDESETNQFEIDRLNNVLNQISLGALENLVWINSVIVPKLNDELDEELTKYPLSDDPREVKRLREVTQSRQNVSTQLSKWIYENYDPNSKIVKEKFDYDDRWDKDLQMEFNRERWLEEHEVDKNKNRYWSEYISLGIMHAVTDGGGGWGSAGGTVYKLTDFGRQFIEYLSTE